MKKLPFSVFRRGRRKFYYVAYKNQLTGKALPAISTKQEKYDDAVATAFDWLKNGVPKDNKVLSFKKYSLRDMADEVDLNSDDAEYICKKLKQRNLIKDYILPNTKKAILLKDYLLTHWDWDRSEYIQEKLRKNHGIHRRYVTEMFNICRLYWVDYFNDKMLGDITRKDVNNMVKHLQTLAKEAEEKIEQLKIEDPDKKINLKYPKSAKHKNKILRACFIPIRYAYRTGELDSDPTSGTIMFSGDSNKRNILTPELAKAIFSFEWDDPRSKLVNILSAITGMRCGEIQALRVKDLGSNCIYVNHSWNSKDKLKPTKNNEPRQVEISFPWVIQSLIDIAKQNPHGTSMESFIFWALKSPEKPMEGEIFLRDLRKYLIKAGLNKDEAKEYCFHSWRHFFTTYMKNKGKVEDKILQGMTGHKTIQMLNHYSDHELTEDREKLRIAQKEVFGEMFPVAQWRV